MDRLIEAARADSRSGERLEYYDELEVLLGDLSPYEPLYYDSVNVGGAEGHWFFTDPNGYHRLRNVEVADNAAE